MTKRIPPFEYSHETFIKDMPFRMAVSVGVIDVLYATLCPLLLKIPTAEDLKEFSLFVNQKDVMSALENIQKLTRIFIKELEAVNFDCQALVGEIKRG